jgi:hypothetical protein
MQPLLGKASTPTIGTATSSYAVIGASMTVLVGAIIAVIVLIVTGTSTTTTDAATIVQQDIHNQLFYWQETTNDPIYNPYPTTALQEDYFPWVVFDNNAFKTGSTPHGASVKYKMWHSGDNGTIAVSYSNDGVHWTLDRKSVV